MRLDGRWKESSLTQFLVDVIPGRDGPENLRILKKSQLKVDIGPWRQIVEFSAIGA